MAVKRPLHRFVGFEQPPEFQERGGIGHPLRGQIHAREPAQRLAVVERVFERFVGQAIPLLEEIHPQHALQPDGRAAAFALRIERFNDGQQPRPRNDVFHSREEFFAAGDLLFIRKLGLGETRLVGHATEFKKTDSNRL
jgi:hypothetical protein